MALEEIGKTPVPGENPAGADVRFEPEFEELETEFGKLNSLTASRIVDWEKVIAASERILAEKSKDILVACYLNIALLERDGIEGLATGVNILRDMLETFWETMYPPKKRLRGRINAIEWLSEKIEDAVTDLPHVTWPKGKRDTFVGNLEAIEEFLNTSIEDGPVIRTMVTKLADLVDEEAPPEKSVPEDDIIEEAVSDQAASEEGEEPENISPETPPAPQKTPPPARQTPPPSAETGDESAGSLLKQGLGTLAGASALFMKQEQIIPAAFKLNRFVGWFPVENVPPATDGKTMLPPPDPQIRSTLESLSRSQNWRELLTSAESRVRQFLFWLDLHRYVAEALDNLGYTSISQFVTSEAASFVKRLTGIERLAFSDGTPFADQETREWLKSAVTDGTEPGAASADTGETELLIASETEEARKLIKDNKVGEALKRFRGHLNHAASGKERYVWELAFCRLLLRAKQPRLCQPYVKQILETLDMFKIETWDPALALEGLTVVLTSLQLQDEKIRENDLIENVINRISALDPSKALDYL